MRKPIFNILLIGIFISVISLPLIDIVFEILPENVNNEKRELSGKENYSVNNFVSFLANYLVSYDNNFNGRSWLIKMYIEGKKAIFNESPLPEKVLIGKHGFYYLVYENCMDSYRNVHPYTKNELGLFFNKLTKNRDYLKKMGVEYYVVVVPEKQRIYPEFLPANITKVNNISRLDQLKKHIKTNDSTLNLIDLGDTLLVNKVHLTYFKKDSHWNWYGAFIGYSYLVNLVKKKFEDITIKTINEYKLEVLPENDLDLAKLLGESFYNAESAIKPIPLFNSKIESYNPELKVSEYIAKRKPLYVIGRKNNNGKYKLLMFRDSYTALWSDYISESFFESVFVWKYPLDKAMVEKTKPDIVIHQVAERHLDYLMK